jgi:hypothetical protein
VGQSSERRTVVGIVVRSNFKFVCSAKLKFLYCNSNFFIEEEMSFPTL